MLIILPGELERCCSRGEVSALKRTDNNLSAGPRVQTSSVHTYLTETSHCLNTTMYTMQLWLYTTEQYVEHCTVKCRSGHFKTFPGVCGFPSDTQALVHTEQLLCTVYMLPGLLTLRLSSCFFLGTFKPS